MVDTVECRDTEEGKCQIRGIGEMEESKVGELIEKLMVGWIRRRKESWRHFEMEEIRN